LPGVSREVLCPNTAPRDRGIKRHLYQAAGIPEYGIVDLDSRLVERWTPADERPEILGDKLPWRIPASDTAAEIDLTGYFVEILDR
jgi:Uma2 family endonuclease